MINPPTKDELAVFPPLYATEDEYPLYRNILMHFYFGDFHFFAVEFDGEDSFFGFACDGDTSCSEWGYRSLSQMLSVEVIREVTWQPVFAEKIPMINMWAERLDIKPLPGKIRQPKQQFKNVVDAYLHAAEQFLMNDGDYRRAGSELATELAVAACPFSVGEEVVDGKIDNILPAFNFEDVGRTTKERLYTLLISTHTAEKDTPHKKHVSGVKDYEAAAGKQSLSLQRLLGYDTGAKYNACRSLYGKLVSVVEKHKEEYNNLNSLMQQILANYCPFKSGQTVKLPPPEAAFKEIVRVQVASLEEIKKEGTLYNLVTRDKTYRGCVALTAIENLNDVMSPRHL